MISFTLKNGSGKGVAAKVDENDNSLLVSPPGFFTGTHFTATITTTSTQIIAENPKRKYLLLSNTSNGTINILFQVKINDVATVTTGIPVLAGGYYEISSHNLWLGAIQAIRQSGNGSFYMFEGVS